MGRETDGGIAKMGDEASWDSHILIAASLMTGQQKSNVVSLVLMLPREAGKVKLDKAVIVCP